MKKHILFTIALCIGLTLPATNFGSQSWYDRASDSLTRGATYLSSYMPQLPDPSQWATNWATNFVNRLSDDKKQALFAALVVVLGLGAAYYAGGIETGTNKNKKNNRPPVNSWYEKDDLNNLAVFLTKTNHDPEFEENIQKFEVIYPILEIFYDKEIKNDNPKKWFDLIDTIKNNSKQIPLTNPSRVHYLDIFKNMLPNIDQEMWQSINNATIN